MTHDLSNILKLPVAERILMVEAIWDSIAAESRTHQLTDEELEALEESWAEYRKNPEGAQTWDVVKANIMKKLG